MLGCESGTVVIWDDVDNKSLRDGRLESYSNGHNHYHVLQKCVKGAFL